MSNIDETTKKLLLGFATFFAALIGIVVVVGLLKGDLDPLGVATLLGGIFTGIVSSVVLLRQKGDNDDKPAGN